MLYDKWSLFIVKQLGPDRAEYADGLLGVTQLVPMTGRIDGWYIIYYSLNSNILVADSHFIPFPTFVYPLHGNDAPAPDIHFHRSTLLVRADLTELRPNKGTSLETASACCVDRLRYTLFGRSSVKSARTNKVERWKWMSGAGASFDCHRTDNSADWEEEAISCQWWAIAA